MFVAALIGSSAIPALAGPAPKAFTVADVASTGGLLHQIHGCHFDTGPGMEPDPVNGHHYHDRNCRVIRLGPPPPRALLRRRASEAAVSRPGTAKRTVLPRAVSLCRTDQALPHGLRLAE
jgi:hypothetical protein